MSDTIGTGRVEILGDDAQLLRTLREAKAEFRKTMDDISRERATATVDVDTKRAEAELKKLEAELKRVNKTRSDPRTTAAEKNAAQVRSRALDDEIVKQKQAVSALQKKRDAQRAENKESEYSQKILAAQMKMEATRERALAAAENRRAAAAKAEQRDVARAQKLQEQAARASERARTQAERQAQRSAAALDREIASLPRLRREYAELDGQIERLYATRRKLRGEEQIKIDLKIDEALAKFELLKHTLGRHNAIPPLKLNIEPGREFGESVRRAFYSNNGSLLGTASKVGADIGERMGRATARKYRETVDKGFSGVAKDVAGAGITTALGAAQRLGGALGGLSSASVRLGPFTTSIRGAIVGLSLLAPILLDVIGALGSLVSVAGAAALGVGALGLAAGAFIPLLGGMALLVKPLIGDFKTLTQLGDAYHKAVLKYGEGSKQAKEAQQQLNEALKNADPATKAAYDGYHRLTSAWAKYVDKARPSFMKDLDETFKTANADVDIFGKSSVRAFNNVSTGWQRWMKGLRGNEARNILSDTFDNANKSIQPIMRGLGSIATVLGRVARIASFALPGLAGEFADWAKGIEKGSEDSNKLADRVNNVIEKAKDVGRFFMAAGRFVTAFFSGGVDAGDDFVNTMTNALNRWTLFLESTKGQNSLKSFFAESVSGARELYGAIAPVVTSFVEWASEIAPFARGFFEGAHAVSQFVAGILKLTGLRSPLTALATTLGSLWAIGRISSAATALGGFASALLGIGRAEKAIAGASAAGGIGELLAGGGAAAGAGKIAATGAELEGAAVKGGMLRKVLMGLGGGAVGLNPWIAGATVLGIALWSLRSRAKSAHDAFMDLEKDADGNANAAKGMGKALIDSSEQQQRANLQLKEAKKALDQTKKGTLAHKEALLDYRDAQRSATDASKNWTDGQRAYNAAESRQYQDRIRNLNTFDKQRAAEIQHLKDVVNSNRSDAVRADAQARLNILMKDRAKAADLAEKAENRAAASSANIARATQGMLPIVGAAAQQLGRLARAGGSGIAKTIAVKFQSSSDVSKVAADASRALKGGVPSKIVTKIVADSKDADEAIRRINGQIAALAARKAAIKIGASDAASSTIAKIVSRIVSMPDGKARIKAIDSATGTIAKIISRITGVPNKTARLMARDLISNAARAAGVAINKLHDKTVTMTARANLSQAQQLIALQNSLRDKSVTWTTKQNIVKSTRDSTRAAGRGPIGKEDAVVGEGSRWQGATEYIADHKTGSVTKVSSPTMMALGPNDAVIPTEPRHRATGKKLWSQFAERFGLNTDLPTFARGRKPNLAQRKSRAQTQGRRTADTYIKKHKLTSNNYASRDLEELPAYEKAKRNEDNKARQIQINEGQLKEPDSFLDVVGQDAETGDPIYAVNQQRVNDWVKALKDMASQYDDLDALITKTEVAVNAALKRLGHGDTDNSNSGGVIGRTRRNMKLLQEQIDHENKIIKSSRTSAVEKANARGRLAEYRTAFGHEKSSHDAALSDWDTVNGEKDDIGFRHQDAENSAKQYRSDADAVQGTAESDATSSNPKPDRADGSSSSDTPDAPPTALESAEAGASALDAQSALAGIGQAAPVTDQQKIDAQQSIINAATAQLNDGDPSNDSDAYSAITSAAGAIADIQNSASTAAAAVVSQAYTDNSNFGSARQDLMSSMASNFSIAGNIGATGNAFTALQSGAFGLNPAFAPTAPGAPGAAGVAGGGIVFNQTFNQQPDPHTWSQGVAFELTAALS